MGETLRMISGADGGPWGAVLLDGGGAPVAYPSTATLSATVSRGGDEAALFSPTVAWSGPSGYSTGQFTLSIAASQAAGLDPGLYMLQAFVSSGGAINPAFDGHLEILPTVGAVAPPVAWCSEQDMLKHSDQFKAFQSGRAADVAGFLGQRAEETSLVRREVLDRYEPLYGFTRVRSNTLNPITGEDAASPTAVPLSKQALTAALDGGGLVLDVVIREVVARRSVALVMERQTTGSSSAAYRQEAEYQRAAAAALFRTYQAQIDADLDGVPDHLIGRQCTILPTGTAP